MTDPDAADDSLALRLYDLLRLESPNLVFSSASIVGVLRLLRLGAQGATREEIAALLPPGGAGSASLPDNAEDGLGLARREASGVWGARDLAFRAAFVEAVRREPGGEVGTADFANPDAAATMINAWVAERTGGMVRDLIAPGRLDAQTRLVLADAVYLKAAWAVPFPPEDTEQRPFRGAGGRERPVATMRLTEEFRLARIEGARVLVLPYRGGRVAMLVALPDRADGLPALEAGLAPGVVADWVRASRLTRVAVSLPRFESGVALDLKEALVALGISRAFDRARADLGGIAAEPLFVGEVVHQAHLRVDEEGTEAAAATAAYVPRGLLRPPEPFVADHPFLYLLRDEASGEILFMGRLMDPGARPAQPS